ncbi:MAG: hypothetical protein HYZ53_00765 [Planctomycetes bacterium]|nr:hypothetical protein [Planctomycetota bacterium]
MQSDRYTKFVLTLIAVALWGLLVRDFLPMRTASAKEGELSNVNIAQFAGVALSPGVLDFQFKHPIKVEGGNDAPILVIQALNAPTVPKAEPGK